VVLANTHTFLGDHEEAGRMAAIKAVLSAPVVVEDDWAAVINLDNFDNREAFDDEAVEMVAAFAGPPWTLTAALTLGLAEIRVKHRRFWSP
jgi:GAF domain-containing protein